MQVKKVVGKFLDLIILVSSFLITAGLVYVWIRTIVGLVSMITNAGSADGSYLYAGILIGVSAGIMNLIEGWINAIIKSYKSLTGKSISK